MPGTARWPVRVPRPDLSTHKKSCRIQSESCSLILPVQVRLILHYHTLNRAMLSWSRVIHTNFLTSSQWSRHRFAGCVNNICSCSKSETYRALLAPDDNRLAGLIGTYRARFVSCTRSRFRCGRRSCRRCGFFGRGCAGLCKRQWRNQPAYQSNNCLLQSALLLLRLPPHFVTQGSNGRSWRVNLFTHSVLQRFEIFAISQI